MGWKIISLGEQNPYNIVSYAEAFKIARERVISPNTLVLSRFDRPCAVGNYAKTKTGFCEASDITIIRTFTRSKNAMYCNRSEFLNYACYYPTKEMMQEEIFPWWLKIISKTLCELGLDAVPKKGGNDVLIHGKKVCSMSSHSHGEVQLIGFNLIMNFDYDTAEKAIVPKNDLRETVTGVNAEAGREVTDDEVVAAFKKLFEEEFGEEVEVVYELTEAEREIVDGLGEKYRSEQWIKTERWSPVKDYGRPG